jgi:hypothetical protein
MGARTKENKYNNSAYEERYCEDDIRAEAQGKPQQAETDQNEKEKKQEDAEMKEKKNEIERKPEKIDVGVMNDTLHEFYK